MVRKFRSQRLNELEEAGKIKSSSGVGSKTTHTQRNRKGGKVSSSQPMKIVPYQQVEEGVFIQKVRVKTIKVSNMIYFLFQVITNVMYD